MMIMVASLADPVSGSLPIQYGAFGFSCLRTSLKHLENLTSFDLRQHSNDLDSCREVIRRWFYSLSWNLRVVLVIIFFQVSTSQPKPKGAANCQ